MPLNLKVEVQKYLSIKEFHTLGVQSQNGWTTPILSFLRNEQLLTNIDEARKIKKRATRFTILNDTLNKRGFSMPNLKCVKEDEAKYIL